MNYQNPEIAAVAQQLTERFAGLENKAEILRAVELKALFDGIRSVPAEERSAYGQEVNQLRQELQALVDAASDEEVTLPPIDVTAPFDVNTPADKWPTLLPTENGSVH